jgi:hypothetical protein
MRLLLLLKAKIIVQIKLLLGSHKVRNNFVIPWEINKWIMSQRAEPTFSKEYGFIAGKLISVCHFGER